MNLKYLSVYPEWHCRKAGGLFLGIQLHFPASIYDTEAFVNNHIYTATKLKLGFCLFSIVIMVKYNYKKTGMI